jgi:LmbE family N-acetylglucosaminyl deacetylase
LNGARFAAKPLDGGGTPVQAWISALSAGRPPLLDLSGCAALVVVAPHPDDETLGLGATAAQLTRAGVDVRVVSVSDGGAAQPDAPLRDRARLEATRQHELLTATEVLGLHPPVCLGLPDGRLAEHEDRLTDLLVGILDGSAPRTWCATTWRGDGHPDHEAVGRAAAAACARTGVTLLEYPVWMWHWAVPDDPAVPWDRARAVPLSPWAVDRKSRAAQCFQSQFEPPAPGLPPVLPAFVLRRLLAVGEVVFR